MKRKVLVIMSTYKSGQSLVRQLDSIFSQEGVDVSVFIRDDGSPDNTVEIIKEYKNNNSNAKIEYIVAQNKGYAKSFIDALNIAGEADYYAFSDQDDVWEKDKLIKTIAPMEKADGQIPMLSYCNMKRSDEQLRVYDEQINVIKPEALTKKLVLTQTYNYGAATVFNKSAKELACRCKPEGYDIPHDYWLGLLCFWFGKVFFVEEKLYYWIRYSTSVSGEGTKLSGMKHRLKECSKKKSYPNVACELLTYYSDLLEEEDKAFLNDIVEYKKNICSKMKLLLDNKFTRSKTSGTLMLKLGILLNWY